MLKLTEIEIGGDLLDDGGFEDLIAEIQGDGEKISLGKQEEKDGPNESGEFGGDGDAVADSGMSNEWWQRQYWIAARSAANYNTIQFLALESI